MLKLRQDLPENFRVTKQIPGLGMVMFNTEKVHPNDYQKWFDLGFQDLFELIIEEVIEEVIEKVEEVIEKKRRRRKNEDQERTDSETV